MRSLENQIAIRNLNSSLVGLGFRIFGQDVEQAQVDDIEKTLLSCVQEIVLKQDGRLMSVLFSWLKVHHKVVFVSKFAKLAKESKLSNEMRIVVKAAIFYVAEFAGRHWAQSAQSIKTRGYYSLEGLTYAQADQGTLSRCVPSLKKGHLLLTVGSLRIREQDVFPVEFLVKHNEFYKNRLLFGPSWRADIVTCFERGIRSPYKISKALGCAYSTAHGICADLGLVL